MEIKLFDVIKHKASMDVAISIHGIYYREDRIEINGTWVNLGQEESYPIGQSVNFEIRHDKLRNWLVCKEPKAKCLRHVEWEPAL